MKLWWEWNREVELGAYTQEEVEDFTGCIPLFLKKCIVKGENGEEDKISLETEFFETVFDEAAKFERNLQAECNKDPENLYLYAAVVLPIQLR
jgi:hypothetical protein